MGIFDQYDAQLDAEQYRTFGVHMVLLGATVTAIPDDEEVIMGDMSVESVIWSVPRKQLPAGFCRGALAVVDGVTYEVARIYKDDGQNAQFELEKV